MILVPLMSTVPPAEPPDTTGPSGETKPADSPIEIYRHSSAHLLAAAVTELFPEAQCGIGPPTDDGFFYDFLVARPVHAGGPPRHREEDGAHRQAEPEDREEADPQAGGARGLREEGPDPEGPAHHREGPGRHRAVLHDGRVHRLLPRAAPAEHEGDQGLQAEARACRSPTGRARKATPRCSASTGTPSSPRKSWTRTSTISKRPSAATTASWARELDLFSIADETGRRPHPLAPQGRVHPEADRGLLARRAPRGRLRHRLLARTSRTSSSGTPAGTPSTTRPTCTRPSTSRASSTS